MRWAVVLLIGIAGCLAVVMSFKGSVSRTAPPTSAVRQALPALTITPPIAAEPNDIFEDVTEKAGVAVRGDEPLIRKDTI